MGRATTQLVLFLIIMNGVGYAIAGSGLGAALEINPELGIDEAVDSTEQAAESFEPSQGLTDTLFGMYVSMTDTFRMIYNLVFFGPNMLMNLGVPPWLVLPFQALITVLVAVDGAHLLTGRDP